MLYESVSWTVLAANLTTNLLTKARGHVLDQKVVGVRAGEFEVYVEHEGERARHDNLIRAKLGHADVQGFPRVGLRGVEGDSLHSPLGLHGVENFLRVRG